MIVKSARFQFIKEDWQKWGINILVFLAPSLLALINELTKTIAVDPKWYPVFILVSNALIDWSKKFVSSHSFLK